MGTQAHREAVRWPKPPVEEALARLSSQTERAYHLPTAAGRVLPADPRRDLDSIGETRTPTTMRESAQVSAHLASDMDPREEDPQMADRPEDPRPEQDGQEDRQEDRQVSDQ